MGGERLLFLDDLIISLALWSEKISPHFQDPKQKPQNNKFYDRNYVKAIGIALGRRVHRHPLSLRHFWNHAAPTAWGCSSVSVLILTTNSGLANNTNIWTLHQFDKSSQTMTVWYESHFILLVPTLLCTCYRELRIKYNFALLVWRTEVATHIRS